MQAYYYPDDLGFPQGLGMIFVVPDLKLIMSAQSLGTQFKSGLSLTILPKLVAIYV